jgi:hypothetical protein
MQATSLDDLSKLIDSTVHAAVSRRERKEEKSQTMSMRTKQVPALTDHNCTSHAYSKREVEFDRFDKTRGRQVPCTRTPNTMPAIICKHETRIGKGNTCMMYLLHIVEQAANMYLPRIHDERFKYGECGKLHRHIHTRSQARAHQQIINEAGCTR